MRSTLREFLRRDSLAGQTKGGPLILVKNCFVLGNVTYD